MINCTRDSCIRIPVDDDIKKKEWFRQIQKFLTRKEIPYGSKIEGEVIFKKYYSVDKEAKQLLIPRFYPVPKKEINVVDNIPPGKSISFKSNIVPRNDLQREAIEWMVNNKSGILCLQPGEGKTVVAIDAISKIAKKTIVYVHKDSLANQWYERFMEHTEIKPSKISRLTSGDYKNILLNCDVVLTTSQLMCSLLKRHPDVKDIIREANFGIAIWDECHTCAGAEQYSRTSLNTLSDRVYGLSATPKRSDGNTDIMELNVGKVFEPDNSGGSTMIPKIVQLKFKHGIIPRHHDYLFRETKWDKKNKYKPGELDRDRYLKLLITSKNSRFLKVLRDVVKKIAYSDRAMILLSNRIRTLDELAEVCPNEDEVGFFIPRSGKAKNEHLTRRLVFSTYGSCRDGVDKPEVDCLVLADPCGNWQQAIGRSVRPKEGKKQPVIIDVVDLDCSDYVNWADRRKDKYLEKNWIVEERIIRF